MHVCVDLLAELQGRLPIRVTLKGLSEADLYRILTEPVNNLIRQQVLTNLKFIGINLAQELCGIYVEFIYLQVELIKSENVDLVFTDDAIREIARVTHEVRLPCVSLPDLY